MEKKILNPTPLYNKVKDVIERDQIAFWLCALVLGLLPIDRMILPFNLKIVDGVVVILIAYGITKVWLTHQYLLFPLIVPGWLILLSGLFATLVGFTYLDSLIAIAQEIYLFVWFIILTNLLKTFSMADIDRLMKIWSIFAVAEATATFMGMLRIGPRMFYTSFFYADPSRERVISASGFTRGVGSYINPNAAAVYIFVGLFVLWATSWPIWLRLGLGTWMLVGIFSTGSMGGLVSTFASAIIVLIVAALMYNQRMGLIGGIAISAGISLLIMLLLLYTLWPAWISDIADSKARLLALNIGRLAVSFSSRISTIKNAWPVYIHYPLGTGPNSFGQFQVSLHNDYVAFFFERGPIGFIGWMSIVSIGLLTPLEGIRKSHTAYQRQQMLALGAGFLACVLNAFVHEVSHFRQLWMLLAFLFALSPASQPQLYHQLKTEREFI
ncbi:MAG: O-antigen ligase family protein [Anaerolineae bacterium]|nr:O-antigen ligase family protein [Anaerolineae bacterium]